MVDSWLRALERAGEVIGSQDPDAAAQARLREQYPADTMFGESGTGRDYREQPKTAAEQAATRKAFVSAVFGPERESVLFAGQQASYAERLVRDWGLSEQEFRLAGQRFGEGQIGAGFGWGALAMAGAIPFFGDIAQGVARAGRGVRGAAATARAAVPPPNPALKAIDDIWHEERLEWLPDFGKPYDEITGETLEGPGIYIDQLDELENAIPGITQFSEEWAYSASVNADARQALADALEAGGEIPDTYAGTNLALGLDILSQSPPVRSPVYRASTFTPDEIGFLREGAEIDLPLSSFTYNQSEMRHFVGMGSEGRSTQVVFTLREGAPAIPIGAIAREVAPIYGEVVTAGRFRIASVREATMPQGTMGGIGGSIGGRPYLDVELEYVAPFELGEKGRSFTVSLPEGAAETAGDVARAIPEGRWVQNATAEEMPARFIERFAEFDRGARELGTNVDDLAQEIAERGFDDPLILEVDPTGRALLIEGNHRLEAAARLGLENVPVRVVTSRPGGLAGRGVQVEVAEGLGSGNLLKPSEVFGSDTIARSIETPRVTPDMSADDFYQVPHEIFPSLSVLDVPADVRYYWRDVLASEKNSRFWGWQMWQNAENRFPNTNIPRFDADNVDEIVKFVDSRPVAPFRERIAQELNQSLMTRARVRLGMRRSPYAPNPVRDRQFALIGRLGAEEVQSMGDALAHWQFVGNNNIQSLLRTGDVNLPFGTQMFDETVYELTTPRLGGTLADEAAVTQYFVDNAQKSIEYLDEFIAGSRGHGGFTGFRGVTREDALGILGIDDIGELKTYDWTGVRLTDPGYVATSVSPSRAAGFATAEDGKRVQGVVFQVDVPASMPAGSVSGSLDSFGSAWNREYEMLLPRGTTFEIIDVIKDPDLLTYSTIDAIVRIRPVP